MLGFCYPILFGNAYLVWVWNSYKSYIKKPIRIGKPGLGTLNPTIYELALCLGNGIATVKILGLFQPIKRL